MARPPVAFLEQEIERLKGELWSVRDGVLSLVPAEYAQLLGGHYDCKNRSEVWEWNQGVVNQIIALVKPNPANEMGGQYVSTSDRAYCPLCGDSATDIYGGIQGFAYPEGLHRHLSGSYNAKLCFVMKVATDLAIERVKDAPEPPPGPALDFSTLIPPKRKRKP